MDVTLAFFIGCLTGAVGLALIQTGLVRACEWIQRNWP